VSVQGGEFPFSSFTESLKAIYKEQLEREVARYPLRLRFLSGHERSRGFHR
jgi:hypothetical protein